MKTLIKLYSFLLLLSLAACLEPPLKNSVRDGVRAPAGQNPGVAAANPSVPQVSSEQMVPADLPVGTIKVALLAPMSGKAEKIGKAMADAAKLGVFTEGSSNVYIMPFDTKGTAEGATEAAYAAMEAAPDAIIGPLFSDEVARVAPIARSQNVPVFAFSNDKKVGGNGVYLLGLMPDQQVERLVMYSAANGIEGFAATVPQNVLGQEVETMLKASASVNRKKVYFTEPYSVLSIPDYAVISTSIATKFATQGALSNSTHALMMPESGEALKRLLASLQQAQVTGSNVRFIGTASWDNPETLMLPELNNAWYSAVPFDGMNSFMTNFQENFGYRSPQLASLSYDAVLLIAELGKEGLHEGAIIRNDGFFGANGAYRFQANGVSERAYDVMEINNGSVTVIDPAQKFF